MIKTNELMLNDWVYRSEIYGEDIDSPYPVQLHLIENWTHRGKDYVVDVGCDDDDELSINAINPIPLTEEILLKNGFVLRAGYLDGNEYILPGEDLYIFYEKDIKKMSVELGPRDIDILYVHQLQHLLRMCGLDELADNLKI